MSNHKAVAIIGAGQSGYWASKTLREQGFAGKISLIGDEIYPPYERPPLSKAVLAESENPESTYFCNADELAAQEIEWLTVRVDEIDRQAQQLLLSDGKKIPYDKLMIATGGRPRKLSLPGSGLKGIHYLRTIEDSLALRPRLSNGEPLLVIGGGWIGLEVAASAVKRGMRVTLVEIASQLCNRVLPAGPAEYLYQLHVARGVDIRLNCSVERFVGKDTVEGAVLSDGNTIPVNTIVAGIGMVPNDELANKSGLNVRDGILVDEYGMTSDPVIYAAGDVARFTSLRTGESMRCESWSNAQNQAVAAAKSLAGFPTVYDPIPWFWTDQYDLNLQIAGVPKATQTMILRGRIETGSFSQLYLKTDGQLAAAISFNAARDCRIAKRLLEGGARVPADKIADPEFDLQRLLI